MQVHLTRYYVGGLAGAWLLVLAAMPLRAPGLVVAGILLGIIVVLGARVPSRPRLQADASLSKPMPVEEDPVDVQMTLENTGRRAIFGEWRIELPGPSSVTSGECAGYRYLPRKARHEFSFSLRFHMFGLQRVGPVHMRAEDPFGFTVLEGAFGEQQAIQVYPQRDDLHKQVVKSKQKRALAGAYEVSQPGTGFEFFGLRGYVPGDRPRDVNWKASGRSGTIIVNQHQKETDSEIVLFVDTRAPSGVGRITRSPFAQGCRAALAIAEAHLGLRDSVRLIAYGEKVHEDRHTGATRKLQGVLDLVVGLEPAGDLSLEIVVKEVMASLRTRSPVVIFSPLVGDPGVIPAVSELLSRDFPVWVIVPRPAWGDDVPETARLIWEAQQEVEFARLVRTGVPAVIHRPGVFLEQSLMELEVVAAV